MVFVVSGLLMALTDKLSGEGHGAKTESVKKLTDEKSDHTTGGGH
jgi:hypothetical protein